MVNGWIFPPPLALNSQLAVPEAQFKFCDQVARMLFFATDEILPSYRAKQLDMIGGANQTRSYSHEQSNRYANGFLPIRGVGGEPPFPPAPYPRQQPSKNDSHLLSTHSSPYLVALSGKTMWNEMISRLHQIIGERLVQIISFDL